MRVVPVSVVGAVVVGLILVGEAAYHAGTVPLGRPTDAIQVFLGAALVAAGAGTVIIVGAVQGWISIKPILAIAVGAWVFLLGMPYLERALVGPDPGFLIRTFMSFEWSPAARFVLFPALREVSALLAVLATFSAVLRRAGQAPRPVRT